MSHYHEVALQECRHQLSTPTTKPLDPKLLLIQRVVRKLNQIFRADPTAVESLVRQSVPCGIALACLDHVVNEDERATSFKVTALGLLNGLLSDLTDHVVVVLVTDGKMVGFGYQRSYAAD